MTLPRVQPWMTPREAVRQLLHGGDAADLHARRPGRRHAAQRREPGRRRAERQRRRTRRGEDRREPADPVPHLQHRRAARVACTVTGRCHEGAQLVIDAGLHEADDLPADVNVLGGAAQAGLGAAQRLQRYPDVRVLAVDALGVGGRRRARWDSLQLFTPRRFSRLARPAPPRRPDPQPVTAGDGRVPAAYDARFDLPVRTSVHVRRLTLSSSGFCAHTIAVSCGAATHDVTGARPGPPSFMPEDVLGVSMYWWTLATGVLNARADRPLRVSLVAGRRRRLRRWRKRGPARELVGGQSPGRMRARRRGRGPTRSVGPCRRSCPRRGTRRVASGSGTSRWCGPTWRPRGSFTCSTPPDSGGVLDRQH